MGKQRRQRTCVPVPTNEQKRDLFGGKRKTSPWMYFQPDSSSSIAAAHSTQHTAHRGIAVSDGITSCRLQSRQFSLGPAQLAKLRCMCSCRLGASTAWHIASPWTPLLLPIPSAHCNITSIPSWMDGLQLPPAPRRISCQL